MATAVGAEIVSTNPADPGDRIGAYPAGGGIDVERAVAAARAAAGAWAALPAQARADALIRVAARIEASAGELTDLVRREVGKPVVEARGEVARTVGLLRFHAQAALDPDGETYPSADGRSLLMARRRPRGVVALITPWNFPLAIPAWKLAPALAYGNACVWKPSPLSPACAEALRECVAAELPVPALQVVHGGADVGAVLVGNAGVSAVSFTGSVAAGGAVARLAAGRGAAVQCEMGGQNASIVLRDADLAAAAATVAGAAMGYAGQKCTATSRVVCDASVHTEMRDALAAAVAGMQVEDPADEACRVGPLITPEARDAGAAAVERGVAAGGRLLAGGSRLDAPGNYLAPALVEVDDPAAELAQEEVFAPVCALLRAGDADAAVELANGVRHGLVTSIFTRDLDRALDLVGRLDTGLVRVNQPTSGVDLHTPFGGEKASGFGPREQGKAAREFYASWRTVLISSSDG